MNLEDSIIIEASRLAKERGMVESLLSYILCFFRILGSAVWVFFFAISWLLFEIRKHKLDNILDLFPSTYKYVKDIGFCYIILDAVADLQESLEGSRNPRESFDFEKIKLMILAATIIPSCRFYLDHLNWSHPMLLLMAFVPIIPEYTFMFKRFLHCIEGRHGECKFRTALLPLGMLALLFPLYYNQDNGPYLKALCAFVGIVGTIVLGRIGEFRFDNIILLGKIIFAMASYFGCDLKNEENVVVGRLVPMFSVFHMISLIQDLRYCSPKKHGKIRFIVIFLLFFMMFVSTFFYYQNENIKLIIPFIYMGFKLVTKCILGSVQRKSWKQAKMWKNILAIFLIVLIIFPFLNQVMIQKIFFGTTEKVLNLLGSR